MGAEASGVGELILAKQHSNYIRRIEERCFYGERKPDY